MTTMTPRQEHAERLSLIAELEGKYNRRFTFEESETFLSTVEYYQDEGYPMAIAVEYAYSHYFINRKHPLRNFIKQEV